MAIMARAQGWADVAQTNLSTAWKGLCAKTMLSWSDMLGQRGPLPDRVQFCAPLIADADETAALKLFSGRFAFAGEQHSFDTGTAPWSAAEPGAAWAEALHGFAWFDQFTALEGEDIRDHMRWLVSTWMTEKGRWDPVAWRPHVTARRLMAWFLHARRILDGADVIWRSTFLRSIARQARHLDNTAQWADDGEGRMTAAIGLAMTGLCLPHAEKRAERGLALVIDEIERQILPDGGHVSRNPETLVRILTDLLNLRAAVAHQRLELPEPIQHALDRMFPMVRFFRHGDGGLAHFNGARDLHAEYLDAILAHDETAGRPLLRANQSGFQRIAQGDTLVIMDTGTPPEGALGREAHAGCLSFELSVGAQRVIANCGATGVMGKEWRHALRATAAHSTVTLADTSSCSFLSSDDGALFGDGRVILGPRIITSERREDDDGAVIEASHDGYESRLGLLHRRRLFLSADGLDLRGEDTLIATGSRAAAARALGRPFVARFHLHPDITAELAWDESDVRLALPDGTTFRFRLTGGSLAIEDSAYVEADGSVRGAKQIVVQGRIGEEPSVVRWTLQSVAAEATLAAQDEIATEPVPVPGPVPAPGPGPVPAPGPVPEPVQDTTPEPVTEPAIAAAERVEPAEGEDTVIVTATAATPDETVSIETNRVREPEAIPEPEITPSGAAEPVALALEAETGDDADDAPAEAEPAAAAVTPDPLPRTTLRPKAARKKGAPKGIEDDWPPVRLEDVKILEPLS